VQPRLLQIIQSLPIGRTCLVPVRGLYCRHGSIQG
jgi:hypothetical protein